MITSQQLDLLRVGLTEIFWDRFGRPSLHQKILNVRNASKEYEEFMHISGLPNLIEWNADGGELPYVDPIQGQRVLFVMKDYGYMWSISKRLMRGNQYQSVSAELVRSAGNSALNTVEALTAAMLISGDAGYDGVPLIATNHPLLGAGDTISNKVSGALSATTLGNALTLFRKIRNNRGQPLNIEPAYLVVSPDEEVTAKQLMNSTVNVRDSAATDYINVFKGMAEVVVSPFLSYGGTTRWFLVSKPEDHRMMLFWREKPTVVTEKDFRTQGILTAITMSFAIGYADWRGIVGN